MFTSSSVALLEEALRSYSPEERAETERRLLAAILTDDLEAFSEEAWRLLEPRHPLAKGPMYWRAMCEYLTAVTTGKIRRLIINVPPRTGKSTLVSIMWPAWTWARDNATSRWLFCSHGEDLAVRHSVRRRDLMASSWYQLLWGDTVQFTSDMNLKHEYASTNKGEMYATWIGGATGRGCDFLVIDDPHRVSTTPSVTELETAVDFVRGSLFTRLDQPQKGAIVLIMQRLHENDLTGELLNPSRDADTERLDIPERKSDPVRSGYEMFTSALRVPGVPPWTQ
jgi:hypothetical protein